MLSRNLVRGLKGGRFEKGCDSVKTEKVAVIGSYARIRKGDGRCVK